MDKKKIIDQVISTIINVLENGNLKIDINTDSDDVAEWTSLKHVLILNEIESVFDITFDFEDILELSTVKEIVDKITELKNEDN